MLKQNKMRFKGSTNRLKSIWLPVNDVNSIKIFFRYTYEERIKIINQGNCNECSPRGSELY